ncbi:MAG: ABC transporter ATP-binding protein [Desulfobacteraceae bacterium]
MITYEGVTKVFGVGQNAVVAVDNVSFAIERGEVVIFLGPSGCGKTTLLRLTNRLDTLTRGNIYVDSQNIMDLDPVKLRQGMGYVIQEIGLFPNKTIAENIAVVPKLLRWSKHKIQQRVDELLRLTRLDPEQYRHRYPAELSGGQQQRIGVARALASDPEILLMDEPFAAIDPINREKIQDEFLNLQAEMKKTIAFVSHDIHEAIKMGDKIALFNQGQLVQYDTPEVILTQPKNKFVADFVGADRTLKVLGLIHVRDIMDQSPPNIVHASDPAPEALKFLEEQHQTFAIVLDDGKPLGYVTLQDLKYEHGPVQEVVRPYPLLLEESTLVREVLSHMLMYDLSTFCVVNAHGDFAGTVTYDYIQKAVKESHPNDQENQ